MADGRKRSGPPEDSSSSRARQRFAPHNYPREAQNMKCIAAVLVVLGMFMTAGATPMLPGYGRLTTSRTVSHGQSSPSPLSFSEDFSNV